MIPKEINHGGGGFVIQNSTPVHIFYDGDNKQWYTTAKTQKEAVKLCQHLIFNCREDVESASMTAGAKHWKTGKPAYYRITIKRKELT